MAMTKEMIEKIAKTAAAMSNGVTTIADVKGITAKELAAVYRVGHGYYTTGRFEEAEKVFHFLCLLEHTDAKFWTALGAARQARKNYKDAIEAYACATLLDMTLPKPHYYAAECALMQGNLDMAESGVRSLLELCTTGDETSNRFRAKALKLKDVIARLREQKNEGGAK